MRVCLVAPEDRKVYGGGGIGNDLQERPWLRPKVLYAA